MTSGAQGHKAALLDWLTGAVAEGWIEEAELHTLESMETRGAEQLFHSDNGRPLTVGFFGGTGVGKSSLLNRLVGQDVAEVGVERPTSTSVTLYVHSDYPVRNLDELFPVDRARVQTHGRDAYRDVVWIDMPDIDSVERANRELVLEWLPYIDWLVYVVSPERYRDDAGWRVLKERGHRHHWLFVMNRSDTGSPEQLADFGRILAGAGFDDTLLIRTSCAAPRGDDFERMTGAIDHAVEEHGLEKLQEIGERARLGDLHHHCERLAGLLGDEDQWREFIAQGAKALKARLAALEQYLRDETAIEAAQVARRPSGSDPAVADAPAPPALVAEYVQDIESALTLARDGLPAGPVASGTRPILEPLDRRLADAVRQGFREGTARPGNAVQRAVARLMEKLVYGLPLIVCVGIGYEVLTRYQRGLDGSGGFLGLDFLVHSLMVLGLAALAPYLLARLLRPSVRRSIIRRVTDALQRTNSELVEAWQAAMSVVLDRRKELNRSVDAIREAIAQDMAGRGTRKD